MRNAIKYSKLLVESGVPKEQAEAQVEVMETIIGDNLATKQDLANLEIKLMSEIKGIDAKLEKLELRMVIKLGTILSIVIPLSIGSVVAIVKLIG